MKILITTDNFLPQWDGIARFLNEIIPRFKGMDITVVAPDYGRIKVKGFKLVQLPLGKQKYGAYRPAKYDYDSVKKEVLKADIVFNQTLGPIGFAAIRAAHKNNVPVVSFTHSLEWELFPRNMPNALFKKIAISFSRMYAKYCYRRCQALIVPSDITAEQLAWNGVLTKKRVVQLGVDTKKFKPGSNSLAKKKLGLSGFVIGYHGRISKEKNLPMLLRAFIRAKIPNKHLLIVGDGDLSIKRKFQRNDVTITGMQADVVPYLQAMDAYVLTSFTETTSLSVLEAMACGLVVVSSRVGFVADYIQNNVNGFFFRLSSTPALAKKLEDIYALEQEKLLDMKAKARATVEQDFNWDSTARRIKKYLEEFTKTK